MKLYELSHQYLALQKLADDPDASEEALADTLEALTGEIELKAQGLLQVVRGIEGDLATLDTEIARLQEMKKVRQNRIDSLRDYLRHNMQATGISSIKCPLFSITLVPGRDMVQIDDLEQIPKKYQRIRVEANKTAILQSLKAGRIVPGASLATTQDALRIK